MRWYPGLGCKRVQDYAFCDLFQPGEGTGASKRGYKYFLLIALNRAKIVHGYGLKIKDWAPAALEDCFRDVCVPEKSSLMGQGN